MGYNTYNNHGDEWISIDTNGTCHPTFAVSPFSNHSYFWRKGLIFQGSTFCVDVSCWEDGKSLQKPSGVSFMACWNIAQLILANLRYSARN